VYNYTYIYICVCLRPKMGLQTYWPTLHITYAYTERRRKTWRSMIYLKKHNDQFDHRYLTVYAIKNLSHLSIYLSYIDILSYIIIYYHILSYFIYIILSIYYHMSILWMFLNMSFFRIFLKQLWTISRISPPGHWMSWRPWRRRWAESTISVGHFCPW
jgi:hypothetical protein